MRWITARTVCADASGGQSGRMDDEQRDSRPTHSSPEASADESRENGSTAATVARMLANPRRIRRN